MKNLKRIPLKHLYNCRDLGGYACDNDGMIAYHKLYRADSPANLTPEEWQVLYEEADVRTVIDLRSTMETQQMPYEVPEGILQICCPMQREDGSAAIGKEALAHLSEEEIAKAAAEAIGKSLTEGYLQMLEKGPELVAKVLNIIGENIERGAVLFHCTAGKDRTGVTAALLYLLCGVDPYDIIADYQVTETYQAQNLAFEQIPSYMAHMLNSDPENMKKFLEAAKEKDYISLLYQNGLKEENVKKIRECVIVTE